MSESEIAAKLDRLRRQILPLLRCIHCGGSDLALAAADTALRCATCARAYRVHAGIPLMTEHPEAALDFGRRVVVENPYSGKWLDLVRAAGDRWVLDLGSGNNPSLCEHMVKLDVFALPNVDVVGIAENLPFRDGVFRTVMSGAVFEHVMDPFLAIDQVHRVLAADGEVYIETAFLQPVHAFPNHYFNMTRQGLERLCGSFAPLESGVQPHQYPSFTLRWILQAWVDKLPLDARRDFLSATVGEVIQEYKTDVFSKRWLNGFAAQDLAELACGVYFHGRKRAHQAPLAAVHPPPEFLATPATFAARAQELRRGLQRRIRRVAARLLG